MARTPTAAPRAQIGMDDQWLEDPDLEALLEDREAAKAAAAHFRKLDKEAKGRILALEITDPRRCGRFIISCSPTQPRSVSFDTEAGVRVSIKTADQEEETD